MGEKLPGQNDGLYGYIYGPEVEIKVKDKGDFFGAIVARKLNTEKESWLHFDQALLNLFEFCSATTSEDCSKIVPDFLTKRPVDKLQSWKRCIPTAGAEECP